MSRAGSQEIHADLTPRFFEASTARLEGELRGLKSEEFRAAILDRFQTLSGDIQDQISKGEEHEEFETLRALDDALVHARTIMNAFR